jgi:hypothetical protein
MNSDRSYNPLELVTLLETQRDLYLKLRELSEKQRSMIDQRCCSTSCASARTW